MEAGRDPPPPPPLRNEARPLFLSRRPNLTSHQRDFYSTFRTPFTLLSTLHAFMAGYCLLKFDLGGFVNCAVSCFRAYFEFEEILHLKSIDFRYIHDSRGTKSCILSFFFYFVVERFRNCGRRENSCLYTYNLKSRKNH